MRATKPGIGVFLSILPNLRSKPVFRQKRVASGITTGESSASLEVIAGLLRLAEFSLLWKHRLQVTA
jgi:hypothetical protein